MPRSGDGVMDDATAVFEAERGRLRSIAYRILGTADDADDAVQDAWLRFSTVDLGDIENPPAWLTTVVTRLSIDRLRSASRTREAYVGPWLPEPVFTDDAFEASPEEATLLAESLSICLLYTSPSPRDATLSRMPSSA